MPETEVLEQGFFPNMARGALLGGMGIFGVHALQKAFDKMQNMLAPKVSLPKQIEIDISRQKKRHKEKTAGIGDWIEKGYEGLKGSLAQDIGTMTGLVGSAVLANKIYNTLDKKEKDLEYAKRIKEYENLVNRGIESRNKTAHSLEAIRMGIRHQIEKKAGCNKNTREYLEKRAVFDLLSKFYGGLIPLGAITGYYGAKHMMPLPDEPEEKMPKIVFVDKEQERKMQQQRAGMPKSAETYDPVANYLYGGAGEYLKPLLAAGALYGGYKMLEGTEKGPYGFFPFNMFSGDEPEKKTKKTKKKKKEKQAMDQRTYNTLVKQANVSAKNTGLSEPFCYGYLMQKEAMANQQGKTTLNFQKRAMPEQDDRKRKEEEAGMSPWMKGLAAAGLGIPAAYGAYQYGPGLLSGIMGGGAEGQGVSKEDVIRNLPGSEGLVGQIPQDIEQSSGAYGEASGFSEIDDLLRKILPSTQGAYEATKPISDFLGSLGSPQEALPSGQSRGR